MKEINSAREAMAHLNKAIQEILVSGFDVRGIDPGQVIIKKRKPAPLAEAFFSGDLSACCGAPLQQTGTCQTCTACGSTTGCG